jgi:hypothetical protein
VTLSIITGILSRCKTDLPALLMLSVSVIAAFEVVIFFQSAPGFRFTVLLTIDSTSSKKEYRMFEQGKILALIVRCC